MADGPRPGWTPEEIGRWLIEDKLTSKSGQDILRNLGRIYREDERAKAKSEKPRRELPAHLSPHRLRDSRWGIVAPQGSEETVRRALLPLVKRRQREQGREVEIFSVEKRERGDQFLARHGQSDGTIDPKKVPYYLLVVGSPDQISFEFQYELDRARAVGRLPFDRSTSPRSSWLKSYAQAVVDAEDGKIELLPRATTFYSVENDETLERFAKGLVTPILVGLTDRAQDWTHSTVRGRRAVKASFRRALGGDETPALVLFSGHGRRKGFGGVDQQRLQGAPVCHGDLPEKEDPEYEQRLFTPDDLHEPSKLAGLIAVFFQCYGIGVPTLDDYPHIRGGMSAESVTKPTPWPLAPKPFFAQLPIALLQRGALAVLGHIDRGWTTTFEESLGPETVLTVDTLVDSLAQLLRGERLGHALRPLRRRSSQLAARLAQLIHRQRQGEKVDFYDPGVLWTAVNDARNLIVMGDPAVYLRGQRGGDGTIRLDEDLIRRIRERTRGLRSVEEFVVGFLKDRI